MLCCISPYDLLRYEQHARYLKLPRFECDLISEVSCILYRFHAKLIHKGHIPLCKHSISNSENAELYFFILEHLGIVRGRFCIHKDTLKCLILSLQNTRFLHEIHVYSTSKCLVLPPQNNWFLHFDMLVSYTSKCLVLPPRNNWFFHLEILVFSTSKCMFLTPQNWFFHLKNAWFIYLEMQGSYTTLYIECFVDTRY